MTAAVHTAGFLEFFHAPSTLCRRSGYWSPPGSPNVLNKPPPAGASARACSKLPHGVKLNKAIGRVQRRGRERGGRGLRRAPENTKFSGTATGSGDRTPDFFGSQNVPLRTLGREPMICDRTPDFSAAKNFPCGLSATVPLAAEGFLSPLVAESAAGVDPVNPVKPAAAAAAAALATAALCAHDDGDTRGRMPRRLQQGPEERHRI